MSGPSNLPDMLKFNAPPKMSINRSCDGYIGFLTIVDVALRHLWTHPIRTKDPPIQYVNAFLKKHGIKNTDPTKAFRITTTKDKYLASSKAFENTANNYDLEVVPVYQVEIAELFEDVTIDAFIMTDGGGQFANCKGFQNMVGNHGYDVTTTAADGSHENGIVQRPHQTLKERIRCMMYSARLGTEFWADTLLHATWLYNRTYHKAVKMTPFQAYTNKVPTLDSFITFGAKLTAKKPGN